MKRRTTGLSPEGWYYLFVVVFVLGGAALRGMNLLLILAGALLGPLLFNWRVAALMLGRVRVHRQQPPRVFAGQPLTVSLTLDNDRRSLTSWAMMLEDTICRDGAEPHTDARRVRVMVPSVPPRQSRIANYRLLLTRRGCYDLGPLQVSSRFPLGLVRARQTVAMPARLRVCPHLGTLTRHWKQLTHQQYMGSQRTARQHGLLEGDYYGLREWRPGDSQRWIHWRTSAKLGELSVRQFEQQRNRDLSLILDLWQPRDPEVQDLEVVETAVSFLATAIGDLCRRGGAHAMIGIAGLDTEFWSGAASTVLADEVWDYLAACHATDNPDFGVVMTRVQQRAHPTAQTVVISTRPQADVAVDRRQATGVERGAKSVFWIDCSNHEYRDYFVIERSREHAGWAVGN